MFLTCFRFLIKAVFDSGLRVACYTKSRYLQYGNKTIRPKTPPTPQVVSTHRRFHIFKYGQNQEMWKRLYFETFPHFQKMSKIGVSIIIRIPHCPTVRNTDDAKILETGQNQEMLTRLYIKIGTFPYFPKIGKIKKCEYVSI